MSDKSETRSAYTARSNKSVQYGAEAVTPALCRCGCGQYSSGRSAYFSPACKARYNRAVKAGRRKIESFKEYIKKRDEKMFQTMRAYYLQQPGKTSFRFVMEVLRHSRGYKFNNSHIRFYRREFLRRFPDFKNKVKE